MTTHTNLHTRVRRIWAEMRRAGRLCGGRFIPGAAASIVYMRRWVRGKAPALDGWRGVRTRVARRGPLVYAPGETLVASGLCVALVRSAPALPLGALPAREFGAGGLLALGDDG